MTGIEALPIVEKLLGDLIKRVKDAQTGALVQQINQHQLLIQRDLIDAQAKAVKIETENSRLIAQLNGEITDLKEQLAAKPHDIFDDYEHMPRQGVFKKKGTESLFCPKCLATGKPSPLQTLAHGWRCHLCDKSFANPDNPPTMPKIPPPFRRHRIY